MKFRFALPEDWAIVARLLLAHGANSLNYLHVLLEVPVQREEHEDIAPVG